MCGNTITRTTSNSAAKMPMPITSSQAIAVVNRPIARMTALGARSIARMKGLAERAIAASETLHHRELVARHGTPHSPITGREETLIVVAMGKLGGGELNVSSDIDLVFLFPEDGETDGPRSVSHREFFER